MRKASVPFQVDEASVFMLLAEMGGLGVCVVDSDGAVARVNPRFCEILGAESFTLEDRRWEEFQDVPALKGIDVGVLQGKGGKALWSGRGDAGSTTAAGDSEWLVWRKKGDDLPGRVIVVVRASEAEGQEDKLPVGRRRKKIAPASPHATGADAGAPVLGTIVLGDAEESGDAQP